MHRPHRNATRTTAGTILLASLAGCAAPQPTDGLAGSAPSGRMTLALADTALSSGAPGLALQASEAVLARHPHNVAALVRRGDALVELRETGQAAASYRQALLIDPQSAGALLGLGRVALESDPEEASARFNQVLAINPANGAALTDRGVAADLQGQHAAAQADYRAAIGLGGDTLGDEIDLAVSLAMSGDARQAVGILEPIAAAPDASPRVRQDLALALTLDGREREASTILLQQMTQDQARQAIAGFLALRPDANAMPTLPTVPRPLDGDGQ